MLKNKWLALAALLVGIIGSAVWAQPPPQPASTPADRCSHKGGPCSWSGDCCMNENLSCDDSSKTCKTP